MYFPYLKEIELIRKELKDKYGIIFAVKKSCASNRVKAFIQKNIMQYKIKSRTDVINLNKL